MTKLSNFDYTNTFTCWSKTTDPYGQPSYGAPVTFACSFRRGGKLTRDDSGQEFMPGTTVWLEAAEGDQPKVGWRMAIGTHTGNPPSDAETIRVVQGWNDQTFSPDDLPDWAVLSG